MYNFVLESKILAANDYSTFAKAVRDYMKEIALNWFNRLEEKERKALIMLDFDSSITTTMMFFNSQAYLAGYDDVLEAILSKAEQIAEQNEFNFSGDDGFMREIAWQAKWQAKKEQEAHDYAIKIAAEMDMHTGVDALESLLKKNSGGVCFYKHAKYSSSRDLRKVFLRDILECLRKDYGNDAYSEEEDE